MPLDGHSFLVAQGWTGKGTGLRQGAISRPLAIPQKKTLAGLGKDRDEAFPFWDHLFSAAAKSIQLKCTSDDEDEDDTSTPQFRKTTMGILSNRRPVTGTPADSSGTNTPDDAQVPRASLLSITKREAAKRGLYARFFRGPVLRPDSSEDDESSSAVSKTIVEVIPQEDIPMKINKSKDDDEKRSRKRQKKGLKEKAKEEKKKEKRRRKKVGDHAVCNLERAKRKEEKRWKRELKETEVKLPQDGQVEKDKRRKDKSWRKEKPSISEEETRQDTPDDEPPDRPSSSKDKDRRIPRDTADVPPQDADRREKKKRKRKEFSP